MSTWVILVAGGTGRRFGGQPKQFQMLADRTVLDWSLDAASSVGEGLVLVVPSAFKDDIPDGVASEVVVGGSTRSESVRAGLAAVPDHAEIIVIHDAARPLASKGVFFSVVDAVTQGADAAVPGVPIVDTIKRVSNRPVHGTIADVVETIDRDQLIAVQTPQAFRSDALRRAHAGEPEASDDAGLIEVQGGTVVVVAGESRNFKITLPEDLITAAALVEHDR